MPGPMPGFTTMGSLAPTLQEVISGFGRKKKKNGTAKSLSQDSVGGAAEGAASGAMAGAGGGPLGALLGAGLGAAGGAISANQAEKDAASAGRPKGRRLARINEYLRDQSQRRAAALSSLSQAAFQAAAGIR